jgi:phosphatidylinositol glycan class O
MTAAAVGTGITSASSVRRGRRRSLLLTDGVAIVLSLLGLYGFAHSFFLAKRSLPLQSDCDESVMLLHDVLGLTKAETTRLEQRGLLSLSAGDGSRQGCWMDRRVDSMAIVVVDALRFDFALYNLPESIGRRLPTTTGTTGTGDTTSSTSTNDNDSIIRSRLFQFVADPPTVTMQRLKALTTGGLPTCKSLNQQPNRRTPKIPSTHIFSTP